MSKTSTLKFESFQEYLETLQGGQILVFEQQARSLGFPIKEGEEIVAYRKPVNSDEFKPLYDRTKEMRKLISGKEIKEGIYGTEWEVESFGIKHKEVPIAGYALHMGSFIPVYDLELLVKQLNLKEITTHRFPIIRGDQIRDYKTIEMIKDKLVGFKRLSSKLVPLYDLKDVGKDDNMRLFSSDEVKFPYVDKYFFLNFKKEISFSESDCVGYEWTYSKRLERIYDVRLALARYNPEPRIFNVYKPNPLDAVVPIADFETFEKDVCLVSYKRHLILKGLTQNWDLLITGPDTEKWRTVRNKYAKESPRGVNDKVIVERYGSEGYKPCYQCFYGACISGSGDSLCSGLRKLEEVDGISLIECAHRFYKEEQQEPQSDFATAKQLSYLDDLLEKNCLKFQLDKRNKLTKGQAGVLINCFRTGAPLSEELLTYVEPIAN